MCMCPLEQHMGNGSIVKIGAGIDGGFVPTMI